MQLNAVKPCNMSKNKKTVFLPSNKPIAGYLSFVESQKCYIEVYGNSSLLGEKMVRREFPKTSKISVMRNLVIFNLAALVGFLLGTASFTASMLFFPNPTFAWLLANVLGGISHFGANFVMQRQTKDKIAKNFIVFNATGIIGFLAASAMFAVAILCIQDSTAAWLCGSIVGTLSHFVLNDKAMKVNLKR